MKSIVLILALFSSSIWGKIEDNSFLLEEAFNQKEGEFQFIQKYQTDRSGAIDYNLELEAPITNETHQFSFDISRSRPEDISESSFSDLALNYRWQAFNQNGILLAEKIGIVLPTGSVGKNTGQGAVGWNLLQAATISFSDVLMNHWNMGLTVFPEAESPGDDKTIMGLNAGTSFVYLYRDDLNFLLEAVFETGESFGLDGEVSNEKSFYLNPGLRFARNFDFKQTQVVPGLSFPLEYTDSQVRPGILLYLSVESTLY